MVDRCDVVVVGAGVVGATTAYELARRGASVTVLEQADDVGGGCSYANAGVLAPSHVGPLATPALVAEGAQQVFASPPAVRVNPQPSLVPWLTRLMVSARESRVQLVTARLQELAYRSADLHRAYADAGLSETYRVTGALEIYVSEEGPAGGISQERARELVPSLGEVRSAYLQPDEAVVESRAYVRSLLAAAAGAGATVRFGTAVDQLVVEDGRVRGVRVGGRTLAAENVVLATGLDTPALAGPAGLRLPLRGGRGYVIDLEVDGAPTMPVRFKERRMVVSPMPGWMRVCGLMEFGAEGRPVDQRRADAMVRVVTDALPGVRVRRVLDTWAGERPCAADGVPVIGASSRARGLTVAAGHGMWGLVMAPVTGEMVATGLLEGAPTLHDPLLSPDRFGPTRRRALTRTAA
ncbi:NAD(P)/FAD-dependent oxidoreductase [Luteipulveratus flavus]|uniref:FAD-dependent oxidoreductase n=1 Tax=Luteipulveratus flavus TaxID=3031728 RepID=A0ABT6CB56_9MICO|nr:FAD-dependent oxidoreductase [Luteipulveratus sp. YIM 133296]MDF8265607.1 FAD-dependent oxidoreductase [Luteipulveratus sp. YIM 133296]